MKLNKIVINNYKSIGETQNILTIDDINIIIGKNESGKTNIIEALSNIDISGINNKSFFKNKNKINRKSPTFELELEPYINEKKDFSRLEKMEITIKSNFDISFSGGYSWYVENDKEFNEAKQILNEIVENNNITFSDQQTNIDFKSLVNSINIANEKVFINYKYIGNIIERLSKSSFEFKEELVNSLKVCVNYLNKFHEIFPTFFYIDDQALNVEYTKKQIEDNGNDTRMLEILLNVAEIPLDLVLDYWNSPDVATAKQIEKEINILLEKNISRKFNEFYSQEQISFEATFDDKSITFLLSTTDTYLSYSERSDGLKWYFNLFLKMNDANLDYYNVIYIMDEPGVKLHVNAQKELLKFFKDLTQSGNQIVYTTHSPYMLDQDNLSYIRPIIKDDEGYTHIYNKYNSVPNSLSKMDTLTPILEAIGMDYKFNFGPSLSKINIITEGPSDANYLNSYMHQKKFKKTERPNIIPSSGVNNINKIASILIGWGCEYFILLDNDQQGRDEYLVLTKKLCIPTDKICFTDGTNIYDTKVKHDIEKIFSETDFCKFIDKPDYDKLKNNYSKAFMNDVLSNKIMMSEDTIKNFDIIFNKINNLKK